MQTELNNITHLSCKYAKKIRQLTEPLQTQFGISYFARQSVTHDGHWEILGNLPEWLAHSADKKFYQLDSSLMNPELYQSGLAIVSSTHAPADLQVMAQEALNVYDIEHCLCIFEKSARGSEWYFFATSAKNNRIFNTYITQIRAIYKYIHYFNTEAKTLLQKNQDYQINIAALKADLFYNQKNQIELSSLPDDLILPTPNIPISPREEDCLRHLLAGKTIKETAKILQLSPRTVEDYLNRLKKKAGCRYKRELVELFGQHVSCKT